MMLVVLAQPQLRAAIEIWHPSGRARWQCPSGRPRTNGQPPRLRRDRLPANWADSVPAARVNLCVPRGICGAGLRRGVGSRRRPSAGKGGSHGKCRELWGLWPVLCRPPPWGWYNAREGGCALPQRRRGGRSRRAGGPGRGSGRLRGQFLPRYIGPQRLARQGAGGSSTGKTPAPCSGARRAVPLQARPDEPRSWPALPDRSMSMRRSAPSANRLRLTAFS